MLVNLYSATDELDQLKTLTGLSEILGCVGDIQSKNIIFGSDLNVMLDYFLELQEEKLSLKKANSSQNYLNKGEIELVHN